MKLVDYNMLERGDRVVIRVEGKARKGYVSAKVARKIRVAYGVRGDTDGFHGDKRVWRRFENVELLWEGKQK